MQSQPSLQKQQTIATGGNLNLFKAVIEKQVQHQVKSPQPPIVPQKDLTLLLVDQNYEFLDGLKESQSKLQSLIPFDKLNIQNLRLDKESNDPNKQDKNKYQPPQQQKQKPTLPGMSLPGMSAQEEPLIQIKEEDLPQGIGIDLDYNYIYKYLLIESKEWHQILQNFSAYLQNVVSPEQTKHVQDKGQENKSSNGSQLQMRDQTKSSIGQKNQDGQNSEKDEKNKENDDEENPVQKERYMNLKKTMNKKTKLQSYEILKFSSVENMCDFMKFLQKHIEFTNNMIYFMIYIGDIVEQSIRYTNLEQFNKNCQIDEDLQIVRELLRQQFTKDNQKKPSDDEKSMYMHVQFEEKNDESDNYRAQQNESEKQYQQFMKSTNFQYKFMSIDDLQIFKQQYTRSVNQLILRIYKSIYSIYQLYPEFSEYSSISIFDKAYQLQIVEQTFLQYKKDDVDFWKKIQIPLMNDFEIEAQKLLADGGTKNKPFQQIKEITDVIKDQIGNQLENMINDSNLKPDLFISSFFMKDIWNNYIINDKEEENKFVFEIPLDILKMAFYNKLGGYENGLLTEDTFNMIKSFLPLKTYAQTQSLQYVQLIDLINFSDFIDIHRIINIYQQDQVLNCQKLIFKEKTIVQELYNHNFSNQKFQSNSGLMLPSFGKYQIDLMNQAQGLTTIKDNVGINYGPSQKLQGIAQQYQLFGKESMNQQSNIIQDFQNSSQQERSVFVRTIRQIEKGDFQLLFILNLFGIKHILNDELTYALNMYDVIEKEKNKIEEERLIRGESSYLDQMQQKFYDKIEKIIGETDCEEIMNAFNTQEQQQNASDVGSMIIETQRQETMKDDILNEKIQSFDKNEQSLKGKDRAFSMSQDLITQNTVQEMQTMNIASHESKMSIKKQDRFSPQSNVLLKKQATMKSKQDDIQKIQFNFSKEEIKRQIDNTRQPQNERFMNNLSIQDLNFIGFDNLLRVNEIFENYEAKENMDDSSESINVYAGSKELLAIDMCSRSNIQFKDLYLNNLQQLKQHQQIGQNFTLREDNKLLKDYNNIKDILTGNQSFILQRIQKKLAKQIGDIFGNYNEIKKSDEYEGYKKKDRGYLIQFEQINEVKFITQNQIFQRIMQQQNVFNQGQDEKLGATLRLDPSYPDSAPPKDFYDEYGFEKRQISKAYLPIFIPFDILLINEAKLQNSARISDQNYKKRNIIDSILSQKVLEFYVFKDMNTIIQKQLIKEMNEKIYKSPFNKKIQAEELPAANLNILKDYVFQQMKVNFFEIQEMHTQTQMALVRQMLCKRYYDIFLKLSAISIDGFKRERYLIKIDFLEKNIEKAIQELSQEEKIVESGSLQNNKDGLTQKIKHITELMLKVEELTAEKQKMKKTLEEKEQKWIQNDTIFKERRIIMNSIIKYKLDMCMQEYFYQKLLEMKENHQNLSQRAYETLFFSIQQIFSQNRLPSINFMAEIDNFRDSQQEEISQLSITQNELTSKVQAIEEEQKDMMKKISDMQSICKLHEEKEKLIRDLAEQEIRIANLRKLLGKTQDDGKDQSSIKKK